MSDPLMMTRRLQDEQQKALHDQIHFYSSSAARAQFEKKGLGQAYNTKIRDREGQLAEEYNRQLEARREKLHQLLLSESESWEGKIRTQSARSTEHQLQQMREKVAVYKAAKEKSRAALAEAKLLERWRLDCDELRLLDSTILAKKVQEGRAIQLEEQRQKHLARQKEEQFYFTQAEESRRAADLKEKKAMESRQLVSLQNRASLEQQMVEYYAKIREIEKSKQEEASAMKARIDWEIQQEDVLMERNRLELRRKAEEVSKDNQSKIAKRLMERQKSMEWDAQFLQKMVQEEAMERHTREDKLARQRQEMVDYYDYLKQQKEEERKLLGQMYQLEHAESEKAWEKRERVWRKEEEARRSLLKEVLECRKLQLDEKVAQAIQKQAELQHEKDQILHNIELDRHMTEEAQQKLQKSKEAYIVSLKEQSRLRELYWQNVLREEKEVEDKLKAETDKYTNQVKVELMKRLEQIVDK